MKSGHEYGRTRPVQNFSRRLNFSTPGSLFTTVPLVMMSAMLTQASVSGSVPKIIRPMTTAAMISK